MFNFSPGDFVERNDEYYVLERQAIPPYRQSFRIEGLFLGVDNTNEIASTVCGGFLNTAYLQRVKHVQV